MKVHSDGKVFRSKEEWLELFGRQEESGLSPGAFCESEGISYSSFHKWRRPLIPESSSEVGGSFVELSPKLVSKSLFKSIELIELELPSGLKLRIGGN